MNRAFSATARVSLLLAWPRSADVQAVHWNHARVGERSRRALEVNPS